jgi:hypothetical protein
VDLPADDPGAHDWASVLAILAEDPRPLRLVPSGPHLAVTMRTGQLLSARLDRTVLAQSGSLVGAARGALFIPPQSGPGWLRLSPGAPPEPESIRFPVPRWTAAASLGRPAEVSAATVLDPLPAGIWLHRPGADGGLARLGRWLCANLATEDDRISVVLGYPGGPPVPGEDIARFWATLPDEARTLVRFVPFGAPAPSGPELAALLGHQVVLASGLPVAGRHPGAAVTVRPMDEAGQLGDPLSVPEVSYDPPATVSYPPPAAAPVAPASPRPAVPALRGPGAERPPPIALESGLESGLDDLPGPSLPAALADSPGLPDMPEAPRPAGAAGTATPRAEGPAAAVEVQPVPAPAASLAPPARGLAKEREWLRRTLGPEYDAAASAMTRVLSQEPGLRGPRESAADALADLAAVKLYLSGHAQQVDQGARTGQVGPHVPFGRCVAAGLRRLPSHRGPAMLRAALGDAEWQWYGARSLVTEWAFCPAVAAGGWRLPGTVDFMIWSVTARRTELVDPAGGRQVIFLPGTRFRVLRVRSGQRREVLLREIAPAEIGADGRVEVMGPLDELAVAGLDKASEVWASGPAAAPVPGQYTHRFTHPPGLLAADHATARAGAAVAEEVPA